MGTPYDRLRLEAVFVELDARSEQEAKAAITRALEDLGVSATNDAARRGAWRLGELLPDPRSPGRVGVEISPPATRAPADPREAWAFAHALRTSLPEEVHARVEPVFAGDVEIAALAPARDVDKDASRPERARLESLGLDGPAPVDVGWHLALTRVTEAHAWLRARGLGLGDGTLIGHPDTGYTMHPEIAPALSLERGRNLLDGGAPLDPLEPGLGDQPGHGTATASVMIAPPVVDVPREGGGARADLVGVAPGAKVAPIRVTQTVIILGWQRRLAEAIEHAVASGCHVVSMSLGGLGGSRLERAVAAAEEGGVIVVAAAGNVVPFVVWPALYPTVVACAGVRSDGRAWSGSAHGSEVDVSAPAASVWVAGWEEDEGARVPVARPGSGTSFATAMVAGAAALWRSARAKELANVPAGRVPALFRAALAKTSRRSDDLPEGFGAGILDCEALVSTSLADIEAGAREEARPMRAVDPLLRGVDSLLFRPDAGTDKAGDGRALAGALDEAARAELAFHLALDPSLRAGGLLATPRQASPRLARALRGARAVLPVAPIGAPQPNEAVPRDAPQEPPQTPRSASGDPGTRTVEVARIVINLDVRVRVVTRRA